jgi:predicted extracellular nuclease
MKSFATALRALAAALFVTNTLAQSVQEINGDSFLSPYNGRTVANVSGTVTARGPDGFWLRARSDDNAITSDSIYVFGRNVNVTVGSTISLNGRVSEYRSSPAYIPLTEITSPSNVRVISTGADVEPLELGSGDLLPPTEQFTSLDDGDVFGLPNNRSQISVANPTLEPSEYGLDFWESLMGELVTIKSPHAVAKPNQFGDTWVVGTWPVTGENGRTGLTMTDGDANPEAILIGTPLDGSSNPRDTKLGDSLEDITGVVYQAFGFYRILPTTAVSVIDSLEPALPNPVSFESSGQCSAITVGQYNIENLAPTSEHLPGIAEHIVNYLNTPDIMFLQEVQDNSGPTNDGVVSANETLTALADAIASISSVTYDFVEIEPVNNADGGQPGGNIRVAYLYNPSVLALTPANASGDSTTAVSVLPGPALSLNPGRIAPNDPAWTNSRKPLVAQWTVLSSSSTFFTVNVHFASKGGSSSIEGDARPPVNGGVLDRLAQANLTAEFVAQLLEVDPNANVVIAGDFNEFTFVEPLKSFVEISGTTDVEDAAGIPELERYSYIFDMNCQELDHMFVSPRVAANAPQYEHVHISTWVSFGDQLSDHDPAVAKLDLCQGGDGGEGPGGPPGGGPGPVRPPHGGPGGPGGPGKPGPGHGGPGKPPGGPGGPGKPGKPQPGHPGKPGGGPGKPGPGGRP